MWIAQAFRDLKSHGWQVEQVSYTVPHRMARLWVLLVVAYAWMLLLGLARVAVGLGAAPKAALMVPPSALGVSFAKAGKPSWLPTLRFDLNPTVAPSVSPTGEGGWGDVGEGTNHYGRPRRYVRVKGSKRRCHS